MNIWLPIITNLVILGIIIAGAFAGRKHTFKYELGKLIVVCGAGVGLYFLMPSVMKLAEKIPFVAKLIAIDAACVKLTLLAALFLIAYIIVSIIFRAVSISYRKKMVNKSIALANKAKRVKPRGMTKEDNRALKRKEKELRKAHRKNIKQAVKKLAPKCNALGVIVGMILAIVIAFAITLPLKPIFGKLAEVKPELEKIECGYEYTPFGQLDKVTDIVNRIAE